MKTKQVFQVSLNGEITYMTPEAYQEFRLQLSTGDFACHKVRRLKRLPKSVPSYMIRDAIYFNPRLAYPTVESIIEAYSNEDKSAEEYSESEDSPLADFVSSFYYGEASLTQILDSARFEDETVDLLKRLEGLSGIKAVYDALRASSELTLGTIYYRDGEFLGATVGEHEHQVDDTLAEAYQTLSPEEKERVRRESRAGISSGDGSFIYTSDDYSRWIMVADEEKLQRRLKKMIKAAQKIGATNE